MNLDSETKTENLYTKDCIRTVSGIYMNVFEPTPEMIDINDIAHALSHQCRFGGHLSEFYSVAQHSLYVTEMTIQPYKLQALMHDASEAYLLDIPSPIKARLADYKEIEDNLMKIIARKFNFQYPLSDEVKICDKAMLEIEWDWLMLQTKHAGLLSIHTCATAKHKFLEKFYELTK